MNRYYCPFYGTPSGLSRVVGIDTLRQLVGHFVVVTTKTGQYSGYFSNLYTDGDIIVQVQGNEPGYYLSIPISYNEILDIRSLYGPGGFGTAGGGFGGTGAGGGFSETGGFGMGGGGFGF